MPEKKKLPAFLEVARRFYGSAFGSGRRKEIAQAMAEWGELSPAEQRFATAHLLYLNTEALAAVLRALSRVGGTLDDVADGLDQVLDRAEEPEAPDDGEPDAEEGGEAPAEGELIVDRAVVDAVPT